MRNDGVQLTTPTVVSRARICCARRWLSVYTEPAHGVSYLTWCGGRGPRTRSRPRSRGSRYRRAEADPDPVVHGAAAAGSMTLVIARPAQVVNKRYARLCKRISWRGVGSARMYSVRYALSSLLPSPSPPTFSSLRRKLTDVCLGVGSWGGRSWVLSPAPARMRQSEEHHAVSNDEKTAVRH